MTTRDPSWAVIFLRKHTWLLMAGVCAAYLVTARVGLLAGNVGHHLSLIWPSMGIALAAALIFGLRVWPAILAGAFLAQWSVGAPAGFAALTAAGNTLEIVAAASLMRMFRTFHPGLRRINDVLSFLLIPVVITPVIGALAGVGGLCLFDLSPWDGFPKTWVKWWMADAMGILVAAPALLVWSERLRRPLPRKRALEGVALFLLLIGVSYVVYGGWLGDRLSSSLTFAFFPFVIWGALRFGQRGAATASTFAVMIAITGALQGLGPFMQANFSLSVLYLYSFVGSATVAGLLLGASLMEEQEATAQLERARDELEERVAVRTGELNTQLRERERVAVALGDSEERYRRITQTITDYIYTVAFQDGHPVTTQHGPGCEAVTGYTSRELAADPFLWFRMVHEDDRPLVLGLASAMVTEHRSTTIEHRIIRKDGAVRWVRNTTVPKFEPDGKLFSYDGLIQDITAHKNAEEAVRESEAKFRAVFDCAGIGIVISSLDGTMLQCNRALERILGFDDGELQGQPTGRILHRDDGAMHKELVRRVLAGAPQQGISSERRYVRKDGRTLWGLLTVTVVRDAAGNPQYALGVVEDITERRLAERERGRLLEELRQALAHVKTLSGLVPICSCCKKIRDDRGYWTQVERYLTQHTGAQFSHGICPECMREKYPEFGVGGTGDGVRTGNALETPQTEHSRERTG